MSSKLINLRKENDVAILFSNEALTALNGYVHGQKIDYNDLLRKFYDALYKMNVECDFIDPSSENLEDYKLILVPGLYAASDDLLNHLNQFVEQGGHVVYSFRSGFCYENVKVRSTHQPGIINKACGVFYNQFVASKGIKLKDNPFDVAPEDNRLTNWMELLIPDQETEVLAYYDHSYWGKYGAITQNRYDKGVATYIGCLPSDAVVAELLNSVVKKAGLWGENQEISFPLITRTAINSNNQTIHFYFNYSVNKQVLVYPYSDSIELISAREVKQKETIEIEPWGLMILEENRLAF